MITESQARDLERTAPVPHLKRWLFQRGNEPARFPDDDHQIILQEAHPNFGLMAMAYPEYSMSEQAMAKVIEFQDQNLWPNHQLAHPAVLRQIFHSPSTLESAARFQNHQRQSWLALGIRWMDGEATILQLDNLIEEHPQLLSTPGLRGWLRMQQGDQPHEQIDKVPMLLPGNKEPWLAAFWNAGELRLPFGKLNRRDSWMLLQSPPTEANSLMQGLNHG